MLARVLNTPMPQYLFLQNTWLKLENAYFRQLTEISNFSSTPATTEDIREEIVQKLGVEKDTFVPKYKYRIETIIPLISKGFNCIIFNQLWSLFGGILSNFQCSFHK